MLGNLVRSHLGRAAPVVLGLLPITFLSSAAHAQAAAGDAADTAVEPAQGLGEIIVTAQRREERLQDVPISVTAIGGSTLTGLGVTGTTAISQVVPSVRITQSGPSAIFFIRGVGNTSGSVGEEGANAIYVDGVYLGDLTSAATKFNNIERVEVLKGPQGTLFGRNSSGGLINIITREPGNDTVISGKAGYGNYDTWQGQLYAAAPIVADKVSIDVALTGRDQEDGFGRNLATGQDVQKGYYYGVRSKLVVRPDDATKLVLSGDYYRDRNDFQNGFNLFKGTVGIGGFTYPGDYNIRTTDPEFASIKSYGTSLTAERRFDWATLTSITAYRDVHLVSAFDADYGPLPLTRLFITSRVRTFQQELRLASATTRPFSWQIGAFYYAAKAGVNPFQLRGTGVGGLNSGYDLFNQMRTRSIAVFGEATYDITPRTHLTGGIRYTRDKRQLDGYETPVNQDLSTAAGRARTAAFTIPQTHQQFTTGRPTYRIALRQDLNPDVNVYASYNRGFKSGLYATTGSPKDPPVKPQTIDAFEIGLKSQLFDNLVRFNLAGFHYKIKGYQVRASPAAGQTLLLNAASVKVDGVEGELAVAPAKGLQFNLIATYLNSRFANFPGAIFSYPLPAVCNPAGSNPPGRSTGAPTGGSFNCIGNAAGNRTPLSPRFASSAGVSYRKPIGSRSEVIFNGLWSYSSRIFFEPDNRLTQSAYSLFNGSIEFRPTPTFGIELWGNNLSDRRYYYTGVSSGAVGDHGELGAPRTYGVDVKFDF